MEITQDINNICADLLERYKQSIKDSGHSASGDLANTARYITKWDGKYFELYFNLQDYWRYLENGTKPHFPPNEAIERWITVKHIIPTTNSGKIKNGTKPTKLLQQTVDGADDLINLIVDEIAKQLQEEINKEEI